jgi:hypothetical protein
MSHHTLSTDAAVLLAKLFMHHPANELRLIRNSFCSSARTSEVIITSTEC